jgi:hypothetical protein
MISYHNNVVETIEGSFPLIYLERKLNRGEKLIVISLYSNTIKVPRAVEANGEVEWEFDDYPLPTLLRVYR